MKEYILDCSQRLLVVKWGVQESEEKEKKTIKRKITFQVWEVCFASLGNKSMVDCFQYSFWDTIYCGSHVY